MEILNSLGFYTYIFPFILIFAVTYGLLSSAKPFGEDARINVVIATVVGFLFLSFSTAVNFMNMFVPFFMVALIVIMFFIMAFKFGGASEQTVANAIKHPAVFGLIIVIFIIVFANTMSNTLPEFGSLMTPINESELSPEGFALTPQAESKQTMQAIMNPSFLGVIVMLLIFAATVYMVTFKGKGG